MEFFTSTALLCLFCVLFFYICLRHISKSQSQVKDEALTDAVAQNLKPIPVLPLWTLLTLVWRFTSFLRSIGLLNPVNNLKFWKMRVVFINDYKLGKALLKNPVFCGRNMSDLLMEFSRGPYGIIFSDGDKWKEQRRFSHQQLKEFGFGTKHMETVIKKEVDSLIESWIRKNRETFSPHKSFYIPILNSIWGLLAGDQASAVKNKKLVRLVFHVYTDFARVFKFPNLLAAFSEVDKKTVLKFHSWLPIFDGVISFDKSLTKLRSYFQTIIDAKRKTLSTRNNSPSDLVEAYLMEIRDTTDPDSQFYGKTGELNLLAIMTDFFLAGRDTTASMLAWAMLHLVQNPDIQNQIREEKKTVVGEDGHPSLTNRPKCPYTETFMLEVCRFSPITTLSIPHANTEDANIGPYFIKKESILFLNIYNIQHDPKIWGDPQNFRPSRFLSEDGKSVVKKEEMCIFSMGLRRCVGEQVARDSMFLYVSSICQRFVLKPDPRLKGLPSVRETRSALHVPEMFNMIAIDRFKN